MLEVLKLFISVILLVLIVSTCCGLAAFFIDLKRFKGEKNMSLPRAKLIEKIIEEGELSRQEKAAAEGSESEEDKTDEEEKEVEECVQY